MSSPKIICTTVATASAIATDTPDGTSPNAASMPGSRTRATAGSASTPRSSDVIVMPSWAPDKWYERRDNKRCTAAARAWPWPARSSIRARSTATRANSAATNPALATTSASAARSRMAVSIRTPEPIRAWAKSSRRVAQCPPRPRPPLPRSASSARVRRSIRTVRSAGSVASDRSCWSRSGTSSARSSPD